jgi:hypothetical protein
MVHIQDVIFNLRLQSRQLNRAATRAEKNSEREKLNIKNAIKRGNC